MVSRRNVRWIRFAKLDDAKFDALRFGRLGGVLAGVSLIDIDQFHALAGRLLHGVGELASNQSGVNKLGY